MIIDGTMDGLIEIFVFCGVLYYFFNTRATNMVDVLFMRLHEVYEKWDSKTDLRRNSGTASSGTASSGTSSPFSAGGREYQRRRDFEWRNELKYSSLYDAKVEKDSTVYYKSLRLFVQPYCSSCIQPSKNFSCRKESNAQPYGVNMLTVDSGPGLFSKFFCHFFYIYGLKTYDYPKLTETVLNDDKLNEIFKIAAWEIANNDGYSEKQAMTNVKDRAKTILLQMESRISNMLLKITAWILYKLLPCFLRSAIIFPPQIEVLKKASDTGLPLIFLPLHRSHLDYVMISFILLMHNIRNPLIAAGDNLRIPFFGWLLRGLGAFFIKRRIDPSAGHKDILYRAVLHTYIIESLRAGHNIEFFVEGGRTRTGKPCMPKGGILSVIVDAYMDGIIDDALIVPIAMNYERLVDGNFVREQLGQPKKMETFGSTMKAIWSTLMGNYGIVKINFCEPFSLSKMLKSFQKNQNNVKHQTGKKILKHTMSNSSLYGTDFVAEEHRQLVDNIARHVVYDCFQSTPIMSTNIVALLLLNKFRDGCTLDELVKSFDVIKKKFRYKNVDMAFSGKTIDIINHALDILGPELVKQQQEEITEAVDGQLIKSNVIVIRPVSILPNLIELSYYSNSMISYYIMDSVAVTALYAELKSEKKDLMTLSKEDVISIHEDDFLKKILKLCDILRYEFIFCKPCDTLNNVATNIIRNFSSIFVSDEIHTSDQLWTRNYLGSTHFFSHDDYSGRSIYKLKVNPASINIMEFLHSMLRPLIDTYTLSAYTLRKLVRRSLSEKVLLHEVLNEIKTNLDNGIINYAESLCVDPIKNSFKLFEKLNILECVPQGNVKIFYLKVDYDTDVAIENFYQDIAAFKWTRSTE
ncbi:glycerol-3-phosphate acyltransferase 1, mitochondrial-like isoform X2 [Vespa mandarinia]|uniref:glycerol-3-phosphate acyltransferase 1, mitochondrial-like isoform X2 n=1 Tax=Vespa mandarinia TaxID=7446 RepID=UPI001616C46E|nr:glycerol-3-phosphate acyltransferase 1, mitochondrial-like isoform X2 [Vespa mandarinia]